MQLPRRPQQQSSAQPRGRCQLHSLCHHGLSWIARGRSGQQAIARRALETPLAGAPNVWSDAPLEELMREAAQLRDEHYTSITFSPKVFIPLTRLCRDSCGYCTFATPPLPGRRAFMTLDEVLQVARLGAAHGCTEALFTLGDQPEARWPQAAEELASLGLSQTLELVEVAAREVLRQTGLLPHVNAGVLDEAWLRRLKRVSASMGLMLEGTAPSLMLPGGAHHGCPDKEPGVRLEALEAAGRAGVPFTTGVLVGIGETRAERLSALRAIRASHDRHGHIQEVIVQNFRPKKGTAMSSWPPPPLSELLWTCAAARLILGPSVSIQAPPNLTPEPDDASPCNGHAGEGAGGREAAWRALLAAGINDWGGISPITRDHVNPEAAWPHLHDLAAATAASGWHLVPRLPVYPRYLPLRGAHASGGAATPGAAGTTSGSSSSSAAGAQDEVEWIDGGGGREGVLAALLRASDSSGLVRGSDWFAGSSNRSGDSDDGGNVLPREAASSTAAAQAPRAASHPEPEGHRGAPAAVSAPSPSPASGSAPTSCSAPSSSSTTSSSSSHSSVPAVRARAGRSWRLSVTRDGDVEGMPRPLPGVGPASSRMQRLLDRVMGQGLLAPAAQSGAGGAGQPCHGRRGTTLSEAEVALLLSSRGADAAAVVAAADRLRAHVCGDRVTYVVNRNINYTNVCTLRCSFCAFSKGKAAEQLRGPAYLVPLEEISRRAAEAWDRGATEVCMQGGIHPDFTGRTYVDILRAAKRGAPHIHVHAFSPLEVHQGASTLGLSLEAYLRLLKEEGLGSLPGTAAEVLCDDVRAALCPDKISAGRWLEVVSAAHRVGVPTTSTLMFGHLEHGPRSWARHLVALRDVQMATGGITEFVPLPFVHMEAPVYLQGRARRGPTLHECVLLHAVARLALHPHITNIQASWVKMGPEQAAGLLAAGCNDMGGVLMNESITRAAGAAHGQELPARTMEALIRAAGRRPEQRTTLYGRPPAAQVAASLSSAADLPLQPLVFGSRR